VIHGDVEETRGTQGFAGRLDLLEVSTKRFLALVETEYRLKCRPVVVFAWLMGRECVVQPVPNCPLERLVKDAAPPDVVKMPHLRLDRSDVLPIPLFDD
jgi:hypothetical protein